MAVPLLAAGIAAGGQILGNALNLWGTDRANEAQREWAEKMYKWQRADALNDMWYQNEYNTPQAQMARLRAAGLNPNLVYGSGSATQSSASVRSSSPGSYSPSAPRFNIDGGSVMSTYYDTQLKAAQVDNLKAQNTVAIQEAALKAAQTAATTQSTSKSKIDTDRAVVGLDSDILDYKLRRSLAANAYQIAEENLRKLKVGTDIALREDERAAITNTTNVREAAERILNMRAQRATTEEDRKRIIADRERIMKSTELQELDRQLKQYGVQPSDALPYRMLIKILESLRSNVDANIP